MNISALDITLNLVTPACGGTASIPGAITKRGTILVNVCNGSLLLL